MVYPALVLHKFSVPTIIKLFTRFVRNNATRIQTMEYFEYSQLEI